MEGMVSRYPRLVGFCISMTLPVKGANVHEGSDAQIAFSRSRRLSFWNTAQDEDIWPLCFSTLEKSMKYEMRHKIAYDISAHTYQGTKNLYVIFSSRIY
jgi:hypothetical protein